MSAVKFRVEPSRPRREKSKIVESGDRKRRGGRPYLPRLSSRRWPRRGGRNPSFRGSPLIRGKFADTDNRLIGEHVETRRRQFEIDEGGRFDPGNEKDRASNSANVRPENFKNFLRPLKISVHQRFGVFSLSRVSRFLQEKRNLQ